MPVNKLFKIRVLLSAAAIVISGTLFFMLFLENEDMKMVYGVHLLSSLAGITITGLAGYFAWVKLPYKWPCQFWVFLYLSVFTILLFYGVISLLIYQKFTGGRTVEKLFISPLPFFVWYLWIRVYNKTKPGHVVHEP